MARPVWSGSVSFGMVSIPVQLVSAVRRQTVSFNQIDREDHARIRYRKVNDVTGEEVPSERIAKAAQVRKGEYVIIDDEDLAPLAPAKSKQIDLETFVPAEDVDPVLFDSSYMLVPDGAAKPYALLASAMAGTGKVGVGRFVMRQKEYLAAVRSDGERLMLSTLVFPDEVVSPASVEGFESLEDVEVAERELAMAKSLVDAMSDEFVHEQYRDEYRAAVQQLIEDKAAGQEPALPPAAEPAAKVIDLAAALEASLRAAAEAKGRHPSGHEAEAAASPGPKVVAPTKRDAPAKKASTKKAATKPATKVAAAAKPAARARKSA